jgi:hypothetical protein
MKNTKRHTTTAAPTGRVRTYANTNAARADADICGSHPPRRVSTASTTTKCKPPTLATATRSVRARSTSTPPAPARSQPKLQSKGIPKSVQNKVSSTTTMNPRASLVHDAVRRAFHSTTATGHTVGDNVTECEQLRGELVRVMADHQRQADEIVALRALARSLKEEVESMQEAAVDNEALARGTAWKRQHSTAATSSPSNREFFQLDAQVDSLREENAALRARIETVEREKRELESALDSEIPRCELLAVQAQAKLESTTSQLHDEQRENDRLRSEVARYKARSRSPVRTQRTSSADATMDGKENDCARTNTGAVARDRERPPHYGASLRESLMSSVASLSMSAASAFSSQLQDDVETLKSELRRLHRSIDASVLSARGGNGHHRHASQKQSTDRAADREELKC